MNAETMVEPKLVVDRRLRLFSLYVDFASAIRARWATGQITGLAGERWKTSTEMWNLDSLTTSEPIWKMITQDAAQADVLIVAMSSLERRTPELIPWLDSLTVCKANRPVSGLFIGLLGEEDQPAGELDWTVK